MNPGKNYDNWYHPVHRPQHTMTTSFKSPAAYVQGRGVTDELGDRIEQLGETALVIGDEVVLGIIEDTV